MNVEIVLSDDEVREAIKLHVLNRLFVSAAGNSFLDGKEIIVASRNYIGLFAKVLITDKEK